MNDDFRKIFYGLLILFVVGIVAFVAMMTFFACGFSQNCSKAAQAVDRTPVAVPPPATVPPVKFYYEAPAAVPTVSAEPCRVVAADLMGDWVNAGHPEKEPFTFTDLDGKQCEATFMADVQNLFNEADLWYSGALPCSSCHTSDLSVASAQLDLSSYQGMVAGARRGTENGPVDIFGNGTWKDSLLYAALFLGTETPLGHPTTPPVNEPIIFAGKPVQSMAGVTPESPTPTSSAGAGGGDQIARPSNPGGPGDAVNLTGDATSGEQIFQTNCVPCHGAEGKQGITNLGSDDGTVPPLNPIDSTLVSSDYKTFAYNIDLFVQHGSTPAGPNPAISMPPWGDKEALTQQQIADVIAYVISLNK